MKLEKSNANPILRPNEESEWESMCVLNPAVIYDDSKKKYIMLYRAAGNDLKHFIKLGLATSEDGVNFKREQISPIFDIDGEDADGGCIEDPRLVKFDNTYYLTYAARAYAPGQYWLTNDITNVKSKYNQDEVESQSAPDFAVKNRSVSYLAMTNDFIHYKRLGRITDSRYDDRDVLLFPEKVNGKYVRISRPKFPKELNGNCEMPSIWISMSEDIMEYDKVELLMTGQEWWETARIGAGCPPIKTEKGWFMLYHGVAESDQIYRVGAVLMDLNNPKKIIARTKDYIMEPQYEYETKGLYSGCVFPTGNVVKDGILKIYYGCADKYIALATVNFDELINFLYTKCKI